MFNSKEFGKLIRKLRKEKGLTLLRLALELNITQAYLGQIEKGIKIPSIEVALSIANYFKISFDNNEINPNYNNSVIIHQMTNNFDLLNENERTFILKFITKFFSYIKEVENEL